MTFDAHKNFAYSVIATGPNPSNTGNSFTLPAGNSGLMPAVPFNGISWPGNANPSVSNAEIVRVTAIDTVHDALTVTRKQEGSSAQNIVAGWQFMAGITAKTLTDIEAIVSVLQSATVNGYPVTANPVLSKSDVGLSNVNNTSDATKQTAVLQAVYPVGSIYMNSSSTTNPATIFGFGTWANIGAGQVLVGQNTNDTDFATLGQTGGNKTHWHWQTVGGDSNSIYAENAGAGSGQTRVITTQRVTAGIANNSNAPIREDGTYTASSVQPYVVVSMWQRTA